MIEQATNKADHFNNQKKQIEPDGSSFILSLVEFFLNKRHLVSLPKKGKPVPVHETSTNQIFFFVDKAAFSLPLASLGVPVPTRSAPSQDVGPPKIAAGRAVALRQLLACPSLWFVFFLDLLTPSLSEKLRIS